MCTYIKSSCRCNTYANPHHKLDNGQTITTSKISNSKAGIFSYQRQGLSDAKEINWFSIIVYSHYNIQKQSDFFYIEANSL